MTTSATASASPGLDPKSSLFSLTEEMLQLDALLDESMGELTPDIEARLAALGAQLLKKTDSIGWFWRTIEARIAGYKKVADDLTTKRKTEENKLARLKSYVQECMRVMQAKKLEGQVYTLAIQANGGRSFQLLEPYLSHPELLPEQFRHTVTRVEPDLEALKAAAIAAGDSICDAQSAAMPVPVIAVLHPAGSHVRLR